MKKYRLHWGAIHPRRDAAITMYTYVDETECSAVLLTHRRIVPSDEFVWNLEADVTVFYNTPDNDFHYPDWNGIL